MTVVNVEPSGLRGKRDVERHSAGGTRSVEGRAADRRRACHRRARTAVCNRARHHCLRLFADPQRDRSGAADARAGGGGGAGRSGGDRRMLGPLGILEPSPAAAELIPDIMLVPLAAFDRAGHRIGYGAGHYDFTLAHVRKGKPIAAIGVAFAVQEIAAVPALPHDVALDYVLTETQAFDFRSG